MIIYPKLLLIFYFLMNIFLSSKMLSWYLSGEETIMGIFISFSILFGNLHKRFIYYWNSGSGILKNILPKFQPKKNIKINL